MAAEETTTAKPSLSDVFNAAVQETLLDFPELRGKFLLVDLEEGSIHGLASLPATRFPTIEALEAYLNKAAQDPIKDNTSSSRYDSAHDLRVIFFNSAAQPSFGGGEVSNALGVVDHELGHLVVPGGMESDTPDTSLRSETIADLFAALRHAKRAKNTGTVESLRQLAFRRADALVEDGGADAQEHFTTFALLELAEQAKTSDFSKMHPQMAVGMAEILGGQYASTANEASRIAASFAGYRETLKSGGTMEQALRKMADATLDRNADAGTARLGAFMLSFYLDGLIRLHGETIALKGDYWDGVREQLKAKEAPPAPSGLIILPKNTAGISP